MIKHHQQVSLLDCGIACVKTILSFNGIEDNIEQYFDAGNTQGMSLLDIERVLKKCGIKSESFQVDDIEKLRDLSFPYLVVVNRNSLPHYIIVLDIEGETIKLSDPANTTFSTMEFSSFSEEFSGIILLPYFHSVEKKPQIENEKTLTESAILYKNFISNLSLIKKLKVFFLGLSRTVLPIVMSLILQYVMVNIFSIKVSNQMFVISSVLFALLLFKIFANLEIREKTEIENSFLSIVLQKYYQEQLENYTGETHYDFVTGYFWNLLNSVTGIFQKFYLRIYVVIFGVVIVFLAYFNILFASISAIALILFFTYNRQKLNDVENVQREIVATSSNFSYLFESSIDGIYDISAFNKKELFYREFNNRLTQMLDVKLSSAKLNDQITTSVQVFSVILISVLVLSSHIFYFSSSIIDYSNSVLIILLIASILQPLLTTWIAFKRSQYSLKFINVRAKANNEESGVYTEIKENDIEKIKLSKP